MLQLHVYAHGPCLDFLRLSGVKETVLQAPVSNIGDDLCVSVFMSNCQLIIQILNIFLPSQISLELLFRSGFSLISHKEKIEIFF